MNLRIPVALLAIPLCSCSIVFNGISKGGSTVDEQQWETAFSKQSFDNVTLYQTTSGAISVNAGAETKTTTATSDSLARYASGEADVTSKSNSDGEITQVQSKVRDDGNGGYTATTTYDGETFQVPYAGPANPVLSFLAFSSNYASYENVGGIYQNELDSAEATEMLFGMDLGIESSGEDEGGLSGMAELTFDEHYRVKEIFVSIKGPFLSITDESGNMTPLITIDRYVISYSFSSYGTTKLSD